MFAASAVGLIINRCLLSNKDHLVSITGPHRRRPGSSSASPLSEKYTQQTLVTSHGPQLVP